MASNCTRDCVWKKEAEEEEEGGSEEEGEEEEEEDNKYITRYSPHHKVGLVIQTLQQRIIMENRTDISISELTGISSECIKGGA